MLSRAPDERVMSLVKQLLGSWKHDNAGSREAAFAQAASFLEIFRHYPEEVLVEVVHPFRGLPGRLKWFPTIKDVKDACDAIMDPLQRTAARDIAALETATLIAPPSAAPEAPEDREALVARLWTNGLRHELQTPEGTPAQTPEQIKAAAEARLAELHDKPSLTTAPVVLSEPLLRKIEEWRTVKAES